MEHAGVGTISYAENAPWVAINKYRNLYRFERQI